MTIIGIFCGIAVAILILHLIAPKNFDVSRTIVINRPKNIVFEDLKSLKRQNQWSAWARKDPQMQERFTGIDGQVGAISQWKGNKQVGEGEQEITKIVEGERVETELRFLKPFKSTSKAYLVTEEVDPASIRVTWGFTGKNKFPMTLFSLVMNMDRVLGKDFEQGLGLLKEQLERS